MPGKTAKKGKATPVPLSGSYVFPNGDKYEGEYIEKGPGYVVRSGQGTHTAANGITYSGQWSNDILNGTGEVRHPSGAVYEGDIVDGEYHGHGSYCWPDGSMYTGPFTHNRMEGRGEFTDDSGKQWIGVFSAQAAHELTLKLK